MKLNIIIYIFLFSLTSCVSQEKNRISNVKTFHDFQQIQLGDTSALSASWGQPTTESLIELEGKHFAQWHYENMSKMIYAKFLIDPSTNKIVEKTYLPSMHSSEANLKTLLEAPFKKIVFKKIPVQCRHFNEVVYISESTGILIIAKEVTNAKTEAIIYSKPDLIRFRIQENQNKKCW